MVDEFAPEPQPKNDLQDLANNLFNKKREKDEIKESYEIKEVEQNQQVKTINYSEPIDERDLRGISGHRISTDILGKSTHTEKQKMTSLDQIKLQSLQISKNEFFDISPTKQENVKEDGDFLNHIAKE